MSAVEPGLSRSNVLALVPVLELAAKELQQRVKELVELVSCARTLKDMEDTAALDALLGRFPALTLPVEQPDALVAADAVAEVPPPLSVEIPPIQSGRRFWTPERVALLESMRARGLTRKQMATELSNMWGEQITEKSVEQACRRAQIAPLPKVPSERPVVVPPPLIVAATPPAQGFWTPAACELIGKLTAASAKDAEIAVQVSALLDRPVTASAVKNQRSRMRIRGEVPPRPTGRPKAEATTIPAHVADVAPPTAVAPPSAAAAPKPAGVRVADREQIRGFVAGKGWQVDPDDIVKVNAKCLAIGAPRFILGKRETAFEVRNWAKVARMPAGSTLQAVNAERTTRGLPVFIVEGGKL